MLSYFKPLIPSRLPLPDWLADARHLTMSEMSMLKLMKQLWRSDWGEGKDVISFDATFEGARLIDDEFVKWVMGRGKEEGKGRGKGRGGRGKTFYRSYVCCMVGFEFPLPSFHALLGLLI